MVVEVWFLLTLITNAHSFENLAYRRPVYELHPWPTTDKDYGSHNAVDGLYTDRSAAGGQCSITADNNYTEALLRIDLEAVVSISYITFYFRTENQQRPTVYTSKMAGFFLYVSNTTSINDGYLCYHEIQIEVGTPSENQNISCSVHGRYITFYNERRPEVVYPDYYSEFAHNEVCELEVYGCREPGNFGEKCSLTCPERCQEKRCNISTGFYLGCLPGYKGPSCKDECELGYYGKNCDNTCSEYCYETRRCHSVTGKCCDGCKAGWDTDTCKEKCTNGTFGPDCRQECGHCLEEDHCNNINGSCLKGCSSGYKGKLCKDRCSAGYFGIKCMQQCSTFCKGNATCNHITGVCDEGCQDGWSGLLCGEGTSSGINLIYSSFVLQVAVLAIGQCVLRFIRN